MATFWKPEVCSQTVLPNLSLLTKVDGKCQNWKIWMRHFECFSNNVFRSNFCLWNNRLVHELPFKKRKVEFYCLKLWVIIIGHSCNFGGMSITLYGSPWSRAASESFGPITATHRKHLKIEKRPPTATLLLNLLQVASIQVPFFSKPAIFLWENERHKNSPISNGHKE